MSACDLTAILDELAAGNIDAQEASRRIDLIKKGVGADAASSPDTVVAADQDSLKIVADSFVEVVDEIPQAERRRRDGDHATERIQVRAVGRRVRIVGDSSVAAIAAEGPHILRRQGGILEVSSDGDIGPSLDGFSMLRTPRSLNDLRAMSLGKELYLRVNPSLTVDVELTAGSLTTEKLPYLGKVRVTAGSATISGVAEVSDALVQAGNLNLNGCFRTGRSRIRCESGAVNVTLSEDSDVTVKADANLGKIQWAGSLATPGNPDEVVIGSGGARLDVGVVMGYAQIKSGEK
ncbi:MAG: hypothetical protein ACRDAX_03005 [Propionibacteriaceae bacterium]